MHWTWVPGLPLYWNWLGLISFVERRLVDRKMLMWNPERNLDLFILEIHIEGWVAQQVDALNIQT